MEDIFVGDIVEKMRGVLGRDKPISQREFAKKLSREIAPHGSISYGAVRNWEAGIAIPPYWFLLALYLAFPGWPRAMALAMLARVRPDLWGNTDHPFLGEISEIRTSDHILSAAEIANA